MAFHVCKNEYYYFSAVSLPNCSVQLQNRNISCNNDLVKDLRVRLHNYIKSRPNPDFQGLHSHEGNYQSLCRTHPYAIILIIRKLDFQHLKTDGKKRSNHILAIYYISTTYQMYTKVLFIQIGPDFYQLYRVMLICIMRLPLPGFIKY